MNRLDNALRKRLEKLEAVNQRRHLREQERGAAVTCVREGRKLVSFSCNNYLGLSHHPRVLAAAEEALRAQGTGGVASRLVTGNHAGYAALEARIAQAKGTEAALVFGSGYLANLGTLTALMGRGDLILADRLAHASLIDGARFSGATFKRFAHNDVADLRRKLEQHRAGHQQCLIVTETVFSMDGDIAPLAELSLLAQEFDAISLADDAHGLGISGVLSPADKDAAIDLQMGTLSKAVGAYGGYVAGSQTLVDYLTTAARSLIYSTALPPSVVASATEALEVMEAEPALCAAPLHKARLFCKAAGLPTPQSPIVPIVLGEESRTLEAAQKLEEAGYLVGAIRPPTVPKGTSRLRLTFSAAHEDVDVERLGELVKELLSVSIHYTPSLRA